MWRLVHVLPNVLLGDSIETPHVALVTSTDDRLVDLRAGAQAAGCLLDAFRDHAGKPVHPAALLVRDGAPKELNSDEAIIAFRNAAAISSILMGWALFRPGEPPPITPIWSDCFDFYPVSVSADGAGLITRTAAVQGELQPNHQFRAMPSPYLPGASFTPIFDQPLLRVLLRFWRRRFSPRRRNSAFDRPLFRSLEVAYQAAATPVKNHSSVYEWGVNVSLWVSAIEILAWPKDRRAGLAEVLDILGSVHWSFKPLNQRLYRVEVIRRRQRCRESVNIVQKLYKALYDNRNAFLHGNPIRHGALDPLRRFPYQLLSLAPLLYRTALVAYLHQEVQQGTPAWGFDDHCYATALREAME